MLGNTLMAVVIIGAVILIGIISLIIKWYKKPIHGRALVRTGSGGTRIAFEHGMYVIPVLHRLEIMDITLKTITIERTGVDGLICKDNMRADIKVAFFVRVNRSIDDAKNVALSIGCARASHPDTLLTLFDAKFSEALKTVGKQFDFVELYTERETFREEILKLIGRNLNGYLLDDCAIDYLEQTALESLKEKNILDAEGIKKITELTAKQIVLANQIEREKEKTLTKQNVEAQETILELNRQLAEKEEKQKREIANIKDREAASTRKVSEEQRLLGEQSKIASDEQIAIAQQNKDRNIIVAQRNKEKTDAIEVEKLKRDRDLQINERERIVALAQIEKEKALEEEKKNIQEVIRERVSVEKAVVVEEEKIKDTREFAEADRKKKVAITNAEMVAEQSLVRQLKAAEAEKKSQEFKAQTQIIEADANFATAGKKADATKILAEAKAAEAAALGKSEAQVIEAKALAYKKEGEAQASVIEVKAVAEAKSIKAKAEAEAEAHQNVGSAQADVTLKKGTSEAEVVKLKGSSEAEVVKLSGLTEAEVIKQKGISEADVITAKAASEEEKGNAEARVLQNKLEAEAKGIEQKATAMLKLDGVGKEHEEFKLRLQKDKEVELAQINIQKDIANAQAQVISAAVSAANIDIVGGEPMFFEKIIGSITKGKAIDAFVESSEVIEDIKDKFLDTSEGNDFKEKIKGLITGFGITSNDIKNLSIANLLMNLSKKTENEESQGLLDNLLDLAIRKGVAGKTLKSLGFGDKE